VCGPCFFSPCEWAVGIVFCDERFLHPSSKLEFCCSSPPLPRHHCRPFLLLFDFSPDIFLTDIPTISLFPPSSLVVFSPVFVPSTQISGTSQTVELHFFDSEFFPGRPRFRSQISKPSSASLFFKCTVSPPGQTSTCLFPHGPRAFPSFRICTFFPFFLLFLLRLLRPHLQLF